MFSVLRVSTQNHRVVASTLRSCRRSFASLSNDGKNPSSKAPTGEIKRRKRTRLTDALNKGPSFDDFVQGKVSEGDFMPLDPVAASQPTERVKLPSWLKTQIPKGSNFAKLKDDVKDLKLHTVCEEARCPNIGECWGGKDKAKPVLEKALELFNTEKTQPLYPHWGKNLTEQALEKCK